MEHALACPGCGAAAQASATACSYCTRPLATIGCGRCYARLFPGMAFCPGCGTPRAHFEQGATVRACPACAGDGITSPLHALTHDGVTVEACRACHGLWVDRATLRRVEAERVQRAPYGRAPGRATPAHPTPAVSAPAVRPGAAVATAPVRYRRCPSCATLMHRVNVARISGVIVDRCAAHGDFFDVDEFTRLLAFWDGGGVDRLRAYERESLEGEQRKAALLRSIDDHRDRWSRRHTEQATLTVAGMLIRAALGD